MVTRHLSDYDGVASDHIHSNDIKRRKLSPPPKEAENEDQRPSSAETNKSQASCDYAGKHGSNQRRESADDIEGYSTPSAPAVLISDNESNFNDAIPTIGGPAKPDMDHQSVMHESQDLRSRLAAFLPRMADANDLLHKDGPSMGFEDVQEGQPHIQMDLGLGVLEERHDSATDDSSSETSSGMSSDISTDDDDDDSKSNAASSTSKTNLAETPKRETNVMDKLLRHDKPTSRPVIDELS